MIQQLYPDLRGSQWPRIYIEAPQVAAGLSSENLRKNAVMYILTHIYTWTCDIHIACTSRRYKHIHVQVAKHTIVPRASIELDTACHEPKRLGPMAISCNFRKFSTIRHVQETPLFSAGRRHASCDVACCFYASWMHGQVSQDFSPPKAVLKSLKTCPIRSGLIPSP